MAEDGDGTTADGAAPRARGFMALPGRTPDPGDAFAACLAEVVRSLGLDVAPAPDDGDVRTWERAVRVALRAACGRGLVLSGESVGVLIEAAVHDPDPSFNRDFVEPALNAAALREFVANGCLDVRRSLLPQLPLRKSAYPPELHGLVDTAVATARSHPDAYLRHRVEHQVGD
ncbi:hypothetical protein [Streptomyces sp. NPDC003717]|uniref:hypothetical protein n=1 Tax=Streptomyces sp. NPDC003717 TaxID=3154276 RepID=UPI0033A52638